MVCLPLDRLILVLLEEFEGLKMGSVSWGHRVVGVKQDAGSARVEVESEGGKIEFEGDYVVGCDGANSQVRKSLYGGEFPGETLNSQIIATNVSASLHFRIFIT